MTMVNSPIVHLCSTTEYLYMESRACKDQGNSHPPMSSPFLKGTGFHAINSIITFVNKSRNAKMSFTFKSDHGFLQFDWKLVESLVIFPQHQPSIEDYNHQHDNCFGKETSPSDNQNTTMQPGVIITGLC